MSISGSDTKREDELNRKIAVDELLNNTATTTPELASRGTRGASVDIQITQTI